MIKNGFVLRKMPGMNLVMPTGDNVKRFNGALMLNDTGAIVFEELEQGTAPEDIALRLSREYRVTPEQTAADVQTAIETLKEAGVAE